jgi:hypothetical protein
MNKVPATPVGKPISRLDGVTKELVGFVVVASRALVVLRKEKRIAPQLDFKIQVEIGFATGILKNLIGLSQGEYQAIEQAMLSSTKLEAEIKSFADETAPPKPVLITLEEYANTAGKSVRG